MSSTVNTFTSNWFKVKHLFMIEEYVERINEHAECYDSGSLLTIHHHNGKIRLTAYDLIDQSFGFYEDEEQEEWIDLEEEIASILEEGEIFRLTSLSWFKGRLETMFVSTYTWDGRRESISLSNLMEDMADKLSVEAKSLRGW